MTRHPSEAQLNDYVDDALDPRSRPLVEAHLAACDSCRAEVESIRALAADISRLPTNIAPARDLRAGIAERIAQTRPIEAARPPRRPRLVSMLAAAAVLVIATATLTRWWMLQEPSTMPALRAGESATVPAPQGGELATVPAPQGGASAAMPAAFRSDETRYLDAIDELQQTLDRERTELAPQTIAILERNLSIIDRAIAESRAALAQDPANRALSRMVLSAYEQKLQLLQRARISAL